MSSETSPFLGIVQELSENNQNHGVQPNPIKF